ncbi:SdrD B-like domain-containing protein [Saccharothrix sp. Mg75]|uniref:SdrD B-like domain-containing protein n=1 Tax=Saccharothrix sp. Mg75 TaxID=3445357 RepID=UPI003EEACD1C
MNIWTTARRTAVVAAVSAPLALAATPAFAEEGVAAQDAGTTISGVAWLDQDSDGVRDAGEPGFAGHTMYLVDSDTAVQTDATGRYTFTGLVAGLSYRVGSMDRSLLDGHGRSPMKGWLPGGSDFDAATGQATFLAGEQNADSGLVLARNDYRTSQIIVHPAGGGAPKDTYQVGDVVDIVGSTYFNGNANDQFGGKLTLPAGLRKVERLGGMPVYMAEDAPNEVTGFFHDRRSPGLIEFLGARVVVEQPVDAADITLEVWDGVFGASDPDLANNTMSQSFSAVAAPVTEPTTEPTTPEPTTGPTTGPTTTEPAPTTTTTAPAVVPVARNSAPLADTGASALGLIGLGGSMLAGGGGALWAARRKRV